MTIRKKTIMVVTLVLLMLGSLIVTLFSYSVLQRARGTERTSALRRLERAVRAIYGELNDLNRLTRDYAAANEVLKALEQVDAAGLKSMFSPDFFTYHHLSFVGLLDRRQQPLLLEMYNLETGGQEPIPAEISNVIRPGGPLVQAGFPDSYVAGILPLSGEATLLSARPVLAARGEDPLRGTLVMGRKLRGEVFQRLSYNLIQTLALLELEDPDIPAPVMEQLLGSPQPTPTVLWEPNRDHLEAYALLRDLYGQPCRVLKTTDVRDLLQGAWMDIRYMSLLLVICLAGGVAVMLVLLDRLVLAKTSRLHQFAGDVCKSGDLSARIAIDGTDELSTLGHTFNLLLETIHKDVLRRKQAENALRIQHELALSVAATDQLHEALALFLKAAMQCSGMDCGGVYVVNAAGGLDLLISDNLSAAFLDTVRHYDADTPQTAKVKQGQALYAHHADLMSRHDPIRDQEGLRAMAILPVSHQGQVIACLNIASRALEEIPPGTRSALEALSAQMGAVLARVRAEDELLMERSLFISGPVVMIKWRNAEGWPVEYVSPNLYEQFGYTAEALLHGSTSYVSLMDPGELRQVEEAVRGHLEAQRDWYEQEYRLKHANGQWRWVHDYTRVVRNPAGVATHFFGYLLDVTDHKQALESQRQTEAQVQHTQKLESLGVLAGGIAHDFNNLLMAILGNADLALSSLPPDSPVCETLEDIIKGAHRAADLCRQMLAYSGKGRFIVEPVDLSALVRDMAHILDVAVSKRAVLRYDCQENLPAVEGDLTQLRQVIMNLIINASEAVGQHSGLVTVRTSVLKCSRADLATCLLGEKAHPGMFVCLEVRDTGCGMDRETLARIFEPFYSTKFTGRGLGLSAVLGIVRGHKGAIKVESAPNRGTSFYVFFPASKLRPATEARLPQVDTWRGSGTVLVVDDDDTVRDLAERMLRILGFEVLLAADGREALAVYQQHRAEISYVLLDLTMPHMDGEETFHALQKMDPQARVILSSGYSEQDIVARFDGTAGPCAFIQKPYTREALMTVFQRIQQPAS